MLACCLLTVLLGVQPTAPDPEEAARRTVVWLREMKTAVAAAPPQRTRPPSLNAYASMIHYDEIAGSWIIGHAQVLALHDKYRQTKSADEIAWFAAGVPLGGECEGYIPCYLSSANTTYGEYLRRHPQGAYTGAAMHGIITAIQAAQDLIRKYPGSFTPRDDCGDLMAVLPKLEEAVQNAEAAELATASEAIHELANRCEPQRLDASRNRVGVVRSKRRNAA
jgi:hypothetical protein